MEIACFKLCAQQVYSESFSVKAELVVITLTRFFHTKNPNVLHRSLLLVQEATKNNLKLLL